MPGILPMKTIRIGSSGPSRISQACDRCRAKKIKCDGQRPCCAQCAAANFSCTTSDKLSRRAFPRGYTESLEERVRALECEVKELQDLLDSKDEQLEMLSKLQSLSPRKDSGVALAGHSPPTRMKAESPEVDEDTFTPHQNSRLDEDESDVSVAVSGPSSGLAFLDVYRAKAVQSGQTELHFNPKTFFECSFASNSSFTNTDYLARPTAPPRMISDQLINVYFQEWAPLFPILNRTQFLTNYEKFVADDGGISSSGHVTATLYLVFGIAAMSGDVGKSIDVAAYQRTWELALTPVLVESSLETLQCLVLAQIFFIVKGDFSKLVQYRGLATGLSEQLLLHREARQSLDLPSKELRKRLFWSAYTVDTFGASTAGTVRQFRDDSITVGLPSDVDDENITPSGFLPTLPGEITRISAALALFQAARILAKVLDTCYPARESSKLSLSKIRRIEADLSQWSDNLSPHLKLRFVQDKPSTHVTGSRSPILSLVYYYTRTLLNRCALGSSLGAQESTYALSVADSSRHIVKIMELLKERSLSFSICLNKQLLLVMSTFGLLYQGLDINKTGNLLRENKKLIISSVQILHEDGYNAKELKRIAKAAFSSEQPSPKSSCSSSPKSQTSKTTQQRFAALASKFSFGKQKRQAVDLDAQHMEALQRLLASGNFSVPDLNRFSQLDGVYPTAVDYEARPKSATQRTPSMGASPYDMQFAGYSSGRAYAGVSTDVQSNDWSGLLDLTDVNGNAFPLDPSLGGPPLPMDQFFGSAIPSYGGDTAMQGMTTPPELQARAAEQSASSLSDDYHSSGEDSSWRDANSPNLWDGMVMPNLSGDGFAYDFLADDFGY